VIGKKNALGDKPATRRAGAAAAPLTWTRLPFATRPLLTTADMATQRETVRGYLIHGLHSRLTLHDHSR
jgi:cohesin loading factor subunit SCC2